MKKPFWIIVAVGTVLSFVRTTDASMPQLPSFLPEYYAPAFVVNGVGLNIQKHSTTNGVEQWQYASTNQPISLVVEFIDCDSSQTEAVFNNILDYLNVQAKEYGGRYNTVEEYNAYVTTTEPEMTRHYFIYRVQRGVQIWTYSIGKNIAFPDKQYESVKFIVNRHRYADAWEEGNVTMGKWGNELYDYASELLKKGQKAEAVKVLSRVIATSPYNYDAHLAFIESTSERGAATNSAKIVTTNSEDDEQMRKANAFLGIETPTVEKLPYLVPKEKGLQLILIALPPCNAQLLEEASEIYLSMTDIPVKVCRLKEEWKWLEPERLGNQRTIERLLVQIKGKKIDFTGWSKSKYIGELRMEEADAGPLYVHYFDELIKGMDEDNGQYRVDQYLERLCKLLEGYCSSDKRTMYVGVTEMNIFSDNNNYLFSQGRTRGKSLASVLSYHMMQARVLNEDYAFRPRLAERLAKEMVPASLKQLGITRSVDPRCPYSYSSGVARLDEKTLTLAEPVKNALQKLKESQPDNK